jgi:hypothetical protein
MEVTNDRPWHLADLTFVPSGDGRERATINGIEVVRENGRYWITTPNGPLWSNIDERGVDSGDAFRQVQGKVAAQFVDSGDQQLKNIAHPVRVYRVVPQGTAGTLREALPLPDKPSIAVLPFDNMSDAGEDVYFADGIAEDIITELSRYPDLFVVARNSSFTYRGKAARVVDVARELGVR